MRTSQGCSSPLDYIAITGVILGLFTLRLAPATWVYLFRYEWLKRAMKSKSLAISFFRAIVFNDWLEWDQLSDYKLGLLLGWGVVFFLLC